MSHFNDLAEQMGVGADDPTLADVVAWIDDVENQEPMPPEILAAYAETLEQVGKLLHKTADVAGGMRLDGWLSLETVLMIAVDFGWHAAMESIQARAAHGGAADARP
jgi:hypothetical protein